MTVIAMSESEITRMNVLRDLAEDRLTAAEAATLMGAGRRQVFRLAKAYREGGPRRWYRGDATSRATGTYPATLRTEVMDLIRERYSDFGRNARRREACRAARHPPWPRDGPSMDDGLGLWKDRKQRMKPVHQPRYRRDCVGELVQIDGSEHWWFETVGRDAPCSSSSMTPPAG